MPRKTSIHRVYDFEAAHHLPGHKGKCSRPHGHSYRIELDIEGDLITAGSSEGMVLDFEDLDVIVRRAILDVLDHQNLNEVLPIPRTTSEAIAGWIFATLEAALEDRLDFSPGGGTQRLTRVRVWETRRSCATVEAS